MDLVHCFFYQKRFYQFHLKRCENGGIIFLDEIDKIASGKKNNGQDPSKEGVQRDLLPIVEGSSVQT